MGELFTIILLIVVIVVVRKKLRRLNALHPRSRPSSIRPGPTYRPPDRGPRYLRKPSVFPSSPVKQKQGRHISQRDDLGHQRRAQIYGVPFEEIHLISVFERDRWTCGICGRGIDRNAVHPDPGMPSLDHIIPLSRPRSPGHVRSNVQASHLKCNLRKGIR